MASVKLKLRARGNKDGTHPIVIQVIKGRKPALIHTGYSVFKEDWDFKNNEVKKSHPNHAHLNNLIFKRYSDALDKAIQVETHKPEASIAAIKQKIKPSIGDTFFEQADSYINLLVALKKFNQYSAQKPLVDKFREFTGGDVAFSDISIGLIERFEGYLKGQYTNKGTLLSARSIANHMVVIRSVYAHARKNNQVIPEEHYPFGKRKYVIKFPPSDKIGLNPEEIQLLENADLSDTPLLNHARNVWLLAFYFAGVRVADTLLLRWDDFKDGRLTYTMGKNDKDDSLKCPKRALLIIEQYRRPAPAHNLVFPDLECVKDIDDDWEVQRRIKTRVRAIDGYLHQLADKLGIEKELTMHIARHTFANLAGDKISVQKLQKLYRHAHISTTAGYQQNFIHEETDEALGAVLGGFN